MDVFLRALKSVRLLGMPLICLALFSVAGGDRAALQSFAWAQMLWVYSNAEGSLVEGASKTFSGKFPCDICEFLQQERETREETPVTNKIEKLEICLLSPAALLPRPSVSSFSFGRRADHKWSARPEAPPAPVPWLI